MSSICICRGAKMSECASNRGQALLKFKIFHDGQNKSIIHPRATHERPTTDPRPTHERPTSDPRATHERTTKAKNESHKRPTKATTFFHYEKWSRALRIAFVGRPWVDCAFLGSLVCVNIMDFVGHRKKS